MTNTNPVKNQNASLWDSAANLLFPAICSVCGEERATAGEGYVGPRCVAQIERILPPYCQRCGLPVPGDVNHDFTCSNCDGLELAFSYARAAIRASPLVLGLIHRFKYDRHLWLEPLLGDLLCSAASSDLAARGWDCLIPVPLHSLKMREREFNQSERLSRFLTKRLGIPTEIDWVLRSEPTTTQTHLGRKDRVANVRRAFTARPGIQIQNRRCVVIDDVLTTGATASAVSAVLRRMGALDVIVWTLARGL